jgi:hypothetical protein
VKIGVEESLEEGRRCERDRESVEESLEEAEVMGEREDRRTEMNIDCCSVVFTSTCL